jgi:DNA-binding IclR family transcriptional regulator
MATWNFLSNHGRALLCISHDPGVRLRDIAAELGVTERSAYAIVNDLADGGYITKERDGRRNRYEIVHELRLPEAPERDVAIGEVLRALRGDVGKARRKPGTRSTRAG